MHDQPQVEAADKPSRAARRTRRLLRVRIKRVLTGVALGLALLVGALTILTRTSVCKLWLLPAVGGALGLEVTARSAMVLSNGTVVLEDAVFRIPGVDGPAGRFMEVARLEVDPDLGRPGIPISRMRVDGAIVRVSQATDSDSVNVQMWDVPLGDGPGSGPRPIPPRIDLRSATIELGEHGPGAGAEGYRVLKRMNVRGYVAPTQERDGAWAIDLHEADPAHPNRPLRGGVAVLGRIDDAGVHLSTTRATLADWPASAVPTRHRPVFEMLAIEGEITRTFLEMPWEGEVAAGIHLENVSMTLPFEPRPETMRLSEERGQPLTLPREEGGFRLTRSGGTIAFIGSGLHASLEGWVEDLPYSVSLEYRGLTGEAPFRCVMNTRDFHLSQNPKLVPFLPKDVFERLSDFQSPTGMVDAEVVIERGEPVDGVAAKAEFSGTLDIREGRASFKDFPYLFEDMEAQVSFDENSVTIERVSGLSASGARVSASGYISPLGDQAHVTIRVTVTGGPVDQRMLDALGPQQSEIIEAIFSRQRLAELEAAGLVLSPQRRDALLGERDALQRRLAELSGVAGPEARAEARRVRAEAAAAERALRAPVFSLSGLADVTVVVSRTPNPETWVNTVEIQMARAGVLPAHFPYPIEATGIAFTVSDRRLTLDRGEFRPLGGGTGAVSVEALLPGKDPGEEDFDPNLRISARGVPVDRLVLHAVGNAGDPKDRAANAAAAEGEGASAAGAGAEGSRRPPAGLDWLQPMHAADLVGTIDADVTIATRPDGQIGFDAIAGFTALRAAPPGKPDLPGTIFVQARSGQVRASEREVAFSFDADVIAREASGTVAIPSGAFGVSGRATLAPGEDGRRDFEIIATGADVLTQSPIERVVGLVSPEGETALTALRQRYQPSGTVEGVARISGWLGEPEPVIEFDVRGPRTLEVTLAPGRVGITGGEGSLHVRMPGTGRTGELIADAFRASTTLGGHVQGEVGLDGRAELLARQAAPPVVGADGGTIAAPGAPADEALLIGALDMRLSVAAGALESPLTRAAVEAFAPERTADIEALDPAGVFDVTLAVRRDGAGAPAAFEGEFAPRSLAMTLGQERIAFHDVRGIVRFDARGGQAEGIRAVGPEWSLAGEAAWTRSEDGQIVLDAHSLSADAASLTPAVKALLPAAVAAAIEQIALKVDGPVSLIDGVIHASIPGPVPGAPADAPPPEASIRATGAVRMSEASALVGVPIEQARGTMWFESQSSPGQVPTYTLSLAAESLRASGLWLENARATVSSGQREGEVLVPDFQASLYGGRLAGNGRMVRGGRDTELRYDMRAQMSGVRFATLLEDRAAETARLAAAEGRPAPAPTPPLEGPTDASRGLLAAEVSLGGVVGRNSTRRGQGLIQIGGGTVMALPLLMPVIEISNLRLPASTPLDVAFAEFYVLGDTVTFEELSAFTPSVEIWGYGTLEWVSQDLDMRFNTRSTSPIPVVSELLEGVRNELVSTRVRGTLAVPEIDTVQFSGTRRVIDTLLGDGPDEQQRRLTEIGERARLNRTRALRAGERLRWLVASQMEGEPRREE